MNPFIFTLLCFSIMILALVFGLIFPRIVKNSFIRFFIVAGIMFSASAIIEYKMEDRDSKKYELLQTSIPIYSLKPTNRITGDFTLGSGSINNTDYYIFLVKRNGGSFIIFYRSSVNLVLFFTGHYLGSTNTDVIKIKIIIFFLC